MYIKSSALSVSLLIIMHSGIRVGDGKPFALETSAPSPVPEFICRCVLKSIHVAESGTEMLRNT